METTEQWLKRPDIKSLRELSPETYRQRGFPRDPMRPILVDPDYFLSPADGHIINSKIVQPDEDILNIKGAEFTINDLLDEKLLVPCLFIQIFLCIFDVHYNRVPLDGYIEWKNLDAVVPCNDSMIPVEDALLEELELKEEYLKYNTTNERHVNRIYSERIEQPYYITQIADIEVASISHYAEKRTHYNQGDKFAFITHGSQTDLIIPFVNPKLTYKSLVDDKIKMHVEAGLDPLVKIWR